MSKTPAVKKQGWFKRLENRLDTWLGVEEEATPDEDRKYRIIRCQIGEGEETFDRLEEAVGKAISDGWAPLGNIATVEIQGVTFLTQVVHWSELEYL